MTKSELQAKLAQVQLQLISEKFLCTQGQVDAACAMSNIPQEQMAHALTSSKGEKREFPLFEELKRDVEKYRFENTDEGIENIIETIDTIQFVLLGGTNT